jgi:hypothetical protein
MNASSWAPHPPAVLTHRPSSHLLPLPSSIPTLPQDDASLLSYYHAALNDDCLKLKLADTPLGLCGSLLAAVADSKQLSHLSLDLDSSREAVWEKVGDEAVQEGNQGERGERGKGNGGR